MPKRKRVLVQCRTRVDRKSIQRKNIDGVEHIVVSSFTLPNDIVMNGGLYPADEVDASYQTLELTYAPVEHPQDAHGNFVSANDPRYAHKFNVGAYNENVRREGDRIAVDKIINVQEAIKSDRGRRLLDRIGEIETNDKARPIHTSTGVFCEVEEVDGMQTNAAGQEYTWIARNMVFDHDAILLDSVGAAQPHQGVGMGINRRGDNVEVQQFEVNNLEVSAIKAARGLPLADTDMTWDSSAADKRVRDHIGAEDEPNATYARYHLWYDAEDSENFGAYKLPFVDIVDGEPKAVPAALRNAAARLGQTQGPSSSEKATIRTIITGYLEKLRNNQAEDGMSHTEIRDALQDAISAPPYRGDFVVEVFEDRVIFWSDEILFSVPYVMDGKLAQIVGIPLPVERDVAYVPKTNQKGDQMKDLMLKALADAGVTVNADISDAELLAKYNEIQTKAEPTVNSDAIAASITNAMKPVMDEIADLKSKVNEKDQAEHDANAELVGNSDKYPGVDAEMAKSFEPSILAKMAANCKPAHGIPLMTVVNGGQGDKPTYTMPE